MGSAAENLSLLYRSHLPFLSSNLKILKAFPRKRSLLKGQEKIKKIRQEKGIKMEEEKSKTESQDRFVTFKPKNYLEILFSAHARTSQATLF